MCFNYTVAFVEFLGVVAFVYYVEFLGVVACVEFLGVEGLARYSHVLEYKLFSKKKKKHL